MKKYVWLLLTFPCLLSAQVPNEEGIEKTLIRRLHALQTGKGAVLRSEATEHLPDSTYTYYDGKLHRAAGFQYNEADWVTLEQGYTDFNLDGLVDEGLKSVYTYTRQGDLLVQEVFTYIDHSHSGAFAEFSRIVNRYDANEMDVDSYEYYPDGYGGWEVHEALVTVEWNERGLPSVLVDSIPGGNGLRAQARLELSYDGQNQPVLVMILVPGASGAWTPYQRIESAYGYGGTPRIDTYFELNGQGAWTSFYFIETRFDEHGNRIYEADHKLGEDGEYHIKGTVVTYRHVYPSGGETAIDGIAPVRSSLVYPNPSTDYVTVTLQGADRAAVTLTDLSGRVVSRQTVERRAALAVHSLRPGMYLLTVQTAAGKDVHKLIVK